MLTSSPSHSPAIHPHASSSSHYRPSYSSPRPPNKSSSPRSTIRNAASIGKRVSASPAINPHRTVATPRSPRPPKQTSDAGTQYSPPRKQQLVDKSPLTPSRPARKRRESSVSPPLVSSAVPSTEPTVPALGPQCPESTTTAAAPEPKPAPPPPREPVTPTSGSSPKRARASHGTAKLLPARYELCEVKDVVQLISSMLMELVRHNDDIPLKDGRLTRFHSRAPPSITIHDYLLRLTTHATLSPPILLSMVYYIDRLAALYPAFIISSLTVHRFLITAATVASKGLSDSFWMNSTYARVGGITLRELALLELEFLARVQWRIVPKPEVLEDYYRSLVRRADGFEVEGEERSGDADADGDGKMEEG
ncbi:MAG: hypothetical protein M1833_006177 [Piccolia ochrophora]|nr:MAG: hypothetical protein M1833_006177 [Piccolia ochrophora]